MMNPHPLAEYSSNSLNGVEDAKLKQRLGLYQVFLRLYDQHRGLLDEILNLENSGSRVAGVALPYVQGIVLNQQVYLVTNLLRGKTQALTQMQRVWTIGRDSQQVLVPIQDKRLSRCHAAIRYVDRQGFQLIDLGSSNGSFVNSELVRQATPLKDGDRIRLGSLTFVFFVCHAERSLGTVSPDVLAQLAKAESASPRDRSSAQSSNLSSPLEDSSSFINAVEADTVLFMQSERSNNS